MYKPLEIILLTDPESFFSRWLLVSHLFHVRETYAPEPEKINNSRPEAAVKDIGTFSSDGSDCPILISARHVHSYARKYGIPGKNILKPGDIRKIIIAALADHEGSHALLTRDLFDDSYLSQALKGMYEMHPECEKVFTADSSMARLRLYPSRKYLLTLAIPLLKLLADLFGGRIHPKAPEKGTLVLWNMTDPFFIRDIIRNTSYRRYILRIIDGRNRVSFPGILTMMAEKIPGFEIESYARDFPSPVKYFPQTLSATMFREILRSTNRTEAKEAFFCGSCDSERLVKIRDIKSQLEAEGVAVSLYICLEGGASAGDLKECVYEKRLSYPDYLKKAASSSIILEIMRPGHAGLSLRPLEALFFRKKLITDNPAIRNSEVYHPDNIFILGEDTDLGAFLRRDFAAFVIDRPEITRALTENYLAEKFLSVPSGKSGENA